MQAGVELSKVNEFRIIRKDMMHVVDKGLWQFSMTILRTQSLMDSCWMNESEEKVHVIVIWSINGSSSTTAHNK